jgi:hypothetical protein
VTRLDRVAIACFVLGAGLLFPFDKTYTILPGILLLLAFVVCGVFALASPERLGQDDDASRGS